MTEKIKGQGFVKIEIPDREVDLEDGKRVFTTNCVVCHGNDGQGVKSADGFTYEYPPLWGNDCYNNGAGMTRVITAAQFIKANMPYGTTYDNPVLTDEEAYDVAGFINRQLRTNKENKEKDFPDLKKKPVLNTVSTICGYLFNTATSLGPFQPIMEYYKKEYTIVKSK